MESFNLDLTDGGIDIEGGLGGVHAEIASVFNNEDIR